MVPIEQLSFLRPPLRGGQRPNFASKHPSCSFRHSVSCSKTLWQSGYYLIQGSKPATTSPTNYIPKQRRTISVLRDGELLTTGLSKLHIHNRLNMVLRWDLTTGFPLHIFQFKRRRLCMLNLGTGLAFKLIVMSQILLVRPPLPFRFSTTFTRRADECETAFQCARRFEQ